MTQNIPAVQKADSFVGQLRAEMNTIDVAQQLLISIAAAAITAFVVRRL